MIKLTILPSHLKNKKFNALFEEKGSNPLIVPFGAKGYTDFTLTSDENKKMNYLKRHRKTEDWENPFTAGSLSRYLLWETDDLDLNIKLFKKKFGFK